MKSLDEELEEGESHLTKKMKEDKAEFVKKFQKQHQIKASDEDFERALAGKQGTGTVLSVARPKKEPAEDDLEEVEARVVKKDKKKRQKTSE
jgi:hypothetical protein